MKSALALLTLMVTTGGAMAEPGVRVHAEVDPLPFARGGYGGQIGVRDDRIARVRVAVASFSLDVPDFASQLGGNEDFHVRVRPSGALYVLYYPSRARSGFAVGGSVRYLRLRYTHDDVPGMEATSSELSPEAIVGYKWHPTRHGFYLQPWFGASVTAWRSADPVVGDRPYAPLPVQLFFTVNLGWELGRKAE